MAVTNLSPSEREVIEHTLGLNRSSVPYRNHFAASPGHDDWETLCGLTTRGLMTAAGPRAGLMPDHCFRVTDAGAQAVGHALAKPIIET